MSTPAAPVRRPRRVPWKSRYDLVTVYGLIWDDWSDLEARQRGISRLSIYVSSPLCPVFLVILHSLLCASVLPYPPTSPSETLAHRLVYGMAITRFINGMVDPLQTGSYAKSVARLAESLGIPPDLVSLRHQATHEDLPSLSILRSALERSIEYFRCEAFWPLIADLIPSSSMGNELAAMREEEKQRQTRRAALVKECDILLKTYKQVIKNRYQAQVDAAAISKTGVKRVSSSSKMNDHELRKVLRDVEVWLTRRLDQEEEGDAEFQTCDIVLDCLLKQGSLVPSSASWRLNVCEWSYVLRKRPDVDSVQKSLARKDYESARRYLRIPLATLKTWLPLLRLLDAKLEGPSTEAETDSLNERLLNGDADISGQRNMSFFGRLICRIVGELQHRTQLSGQSLPSHPGIETPLDFNSDYLDLTLNSEAKSRRQPVTSSADPSEQSYALGLTTWILWIWKQSTLEADGNFSETQQEPSSSSLQPRKRRRKNKSSGGVDSVIDEGQAGITLDDDEMEQIVRTLARGVLNEAGADGNVAISSSALLHLISDVDPRFQTIAATVSGQIWSIAPVQAVAEAEESSWEADISQMEERLRLMEKRLKEDGSSEHASPAATETDISGNDPSKPLLGSRKETQESPSAPLPTGWRLATEEEWTPRPIGVWS